jgi:gluconate 5-dehydrogenase
MNLQGKGVGVTGGGGHLGRALALGLARAGALVVICGRQQEALDAVVSEAETQSLSGRVMAEVADLDRDEDLERVFDRIEKESDSVYGWVNNACAARPEKLMELTREATDATFSSVLTNLVLATQAAAKRMRPHGTGAIVNLSSMYGVVSPVPDVYRDFSEYHNPPAYGAAKGGVIQFTRYAACHLAKDGIRVNCLSPGPFPTDEIRKQAAFEAELAQRVPLGRVAEAGEIVGPALFLLSDASSFVTGHNLVVDGGWTAW